MSFCIIRQPNSYGWITGAYGTLEVHAHNNSGLSAFLAAKCTRTTDSPPHSVELYILRLPHDPFVVWMVTQILPHHSFGGGPRHALNVTLTREDGWPLGSSSVSEVGVDLPDHPDGDIHGPPADKIPTSDEHWLARAKNPRELFSTAPLTDGYVAVGGGDQVLTGKVPETVAELRVTADLRLPQFGGPHDLPARRPLFDGVVPKGATWAVPLKADALIHGSAVLMSFTNPAAQGVRQRTVPVAVSLFDPKQRVDFADPTSGSAQKGVVVPPPLAFRLTRS